jgi:hypothetical protein
MQWRPVENARPDQVVASRGGNEHRAGRLPQSGGPEGGGHAAMSCLSRPKSCQNMPRLFQGPNLY